jgi:hypothetical protein
MRSLAAPSLANARKVLRFLPAKADSVAALTPLERLACNLTRPLRPALLLGALRNFRQIWRIFANSTP